MRLERLTYNKIKIFLTLDDLTDRGLTKDDIWKDSLKWHQLFHDMLLEASEEFGVEIFGSVAVEIFAIQAQGMVMIVTMEEQEGGDQPFDDGFIEMQVTVEGCDEILYEFTSVEEVIQLAKRLDESNVNGGSLYSMNGRYFLHMENMDPSEGNKTVSLLAEYGNPSLLTIHRVAEYGKTIIKDKAIETLVHYFH
ncbi:genetic competence negative regulator [Bacillus sp. T33-2]|uniref:genetic competence negative regulator n=1 Tax=Bacillus sp. T33-2 TaxID=2054168 RepID=UPI000C7614C2|nr:genetic competence negative regulator [Bacillus sp. T33-2]PLR99772.1 adaptor protein [Bacillus sp. T33-2]